MFSKEDNDSIVNIVRNYPKYMKPIPLSEEGPWIIDFCINGISFFPYDTHLADMPKEIQWLYRKLFSKSKDRNNYLEGV